MKLELDIELKDLKNIVGFNNSNLKTLEEMFDASIDVYGQSILTNLEDLDKIEQLEKIFKILLLSKIDIITENKTIKPPIKRTELIEFIIEADKISPKFAIEIFL